MVRCLMKRIHALFWRFPIFTRREKLLGIGMLASILPGCGGGAALSTPPSPPTETLSTETLSSEALSTESHHRHWNPGQPPSSAGASGSSWGSSSSGSSNGPSGGSSSFSGAGNGSPPAPQGAGAHILTFQMTITSSTMSFGNSFSYVAPYLNYAVTTPDVSAASRAAGITTGYYLDLHSICQSGMTGACLIGQISIPESAFEHTCDGMNARILDTHSSGVTQYVSDATSGGLRQTLANAIAYNAQQGSWDFIFDDDAQDLSEIYPYMNYMNAVTGAPQIPAPYCNFNESSYRAGMVNYYKSSSLPVIGNTLMPSGSTAPSLGVKFFGAAPLIGGMIEGIYGDSFNGPDRNKESGTIWQSEENSELAAAYVNRLFIGYEHVGGTDANGIDERNYIYASLMLSFSPKSTVLAEDGTPTNSGLLVNPEALLVPANPLQGEPSNISALQKSGGAYVREYAKCTYAGQSIGQCAAVVNSNNWGSVPMPSLRQSYTHTAVISGAGVVSGIDNGSVNVKGPWAPSSIGAEEAYILTK